MLGVDKLPARIYRIDVGSGRRELWKTLMPSDPAGINEIGRQVKESWITPDGKTYAYPYWRWLCELIFWKG